MPADGWTAIKTDEATLTGADKVAEEITAAGLPLTRAQVLAAATARGVRDLVEDPKSLLKDVSSPKTRKRTPA